MRTRFHCGPGASKGWPSLIRQRPQPPRVIRRTIASAPTALAPAELPPPPPPLLLPLLPPLDDDDDDDDDDGSAAFLWRSPRRPSSAWPRPPLPPLRQPWLVSCASRASRALGPLELRRREHSLAWLRPFLRIAMAFSASETADE